MTKGIELAVAIAMATVTCACSGADEKGKPATAADAARAAEAVQTEQAALSAVDAGAATAEVSAGHCDPPYYVDPTTGRKRYKAECLNLVP